MHDPIVGAADSGLGAVKQESVSTRGSASNPEIVERHVALRVHTLRLNAKHGNRAGDARSNHEPGRQLAGAVNLQGAGYEELLPCHFCCRELHGRKIYVRPLGPAPTIARTSISERFLDPSLSDWILRSVHI